MTFASCSRNRIAAAVRGSGVALLGLAAPAVADPIPGCTVADMTNVMTGVSAGMTAYLFTHPDVNDFFSGLQGKDKEDVKTQTKAYLAANPDVKGEIDAIRAPSVELRDRCNIPKGALVLGVM